MLQTFWWQNLLCLLLSSQVWSHYSSKPPTRQRLCPVLQPSVSTVMEKQYTFKGQSLENGLFCVLQALGNILLQRHKASMTTHRQQSTSAKSLSHVRLCETPMACSPPGSSEHGILQARILEQVAISFSNRAQELQLNEYIQYAVRFGLLCYSSMLMIIEQKICCASYLRGRLSGDEVIQRHKVLKAQVRKEALARTLLVTAVKSAL